MTLIPAAAANAVGNTTMSSMVSPYNCLTTTTSGTVNNLSTTSCGTSSTQKWTSSSSHPYELISVATGKCLTDNVGVFGVYMSACTNATTQRWTFTGLSGLGTFQSVSSGPRLWSNAAGTVKHAICTGSAGSTGWKLPEIGIWG